MDSYEWNKIAGWTLTALVTVLGLSVMTGAMFAPQKPAKPGFIVEGVEAEASAGGAAAETEKPIEFYLASADPAKGESQFKKCAACHTIDKGAAPGIGPNLYGIVGNHHAHKSGFGYSDAMKGTADKQWDWASLSSWIKDPKKYIPGNKMSFAGLGKPEDRANLLAFLNSKSDKPLPIPAAPAEAEAPAAAGDAAAAPAATDAAAAPAADATAAPAAAH